MLSKRRFLTSLLGTGAWQLLQARAAAVAGHLVIVTSYPQAVISHYIDAFSQIYPAIHVDVVWHSGDDAQAYLLGAGKGLADIYWAASLRNFIALAALHQFAPLPVDRTGLPGKVGAQLISDPHHFYEATEVAGYGLLFDPARLAKAGLPAPRQWEDLTKPEFAGHYAMPVPSRIGFAPTITEIILQSRGWKRGWQLLARLADGAQLLQGRGETVANQVAKGITACVITIDFMASQAIARGAPLKFVYPDENAFEPANIAISRFAPDPAAALAYAQFVLSVAGQQLLFDPDLRRLPVRPALYASHQKVFDPFATHVINRFDPQLFARRRPADNALFDAWLVAPRARRLAIRARALALKTKAAALALALLDQVPMDQTAALAPGAAAQMPAAIGALLARAEQILAAG